MTLIGQQIRDKEKKKDDGGKWAKNKVDIGDMTLDAKIMDFDLPGTAVPEEFDPELISRNEKVQLSFVQ